jgi:hypothetical protein
VRGRENDRLAEEILFLEELTVRVGKKRPADQG